MVVAESKGNIRAETQAYAGAVGSGAFGAGAALSKNLVHNNVEARILNSGGSQEAKGDAVRSNALGGAFSAGGAGIAIGFVEASNAITSTTTAKIANSKVTATVGAV